MAIGLTSAAYAQDTISGALLHENYFYHMGGLFFDSSSFPMEIGHFCGLCPGETYVRYIPDDTLTVYGVAAILTNPKEFGDWWRASVDTTEASANSTFYLCLPDTGNNLRRVRYVNVNPFVTPTAYFVNFYVDTTSSRVYLERMIEQPFDKPITVSDTFYIGKTSYGGHLVPFFDEEGEFLYSLDAHIEGRMGMIRLPKDTYDTIVFFDEEGFYGFDNVDGPPRYWERTPFEFYLWIFPILLPDSITNDDTTQTATIYTSARLVDRMCGISPNPASDKVKVTSSFGIDKVEVYDMSGVLITTALPKHTSTRVLTTTINTAAWPKGAYILRIHTPLGVATKKITITR